MVVAQFFEVTVAADGSELSSKRVSKLSRRYHRHKKQLRQSAMMAEASSDAWVCPKCLYENIDYQRCMGPDCDTVRPGGHIS
jgi:rubrerythrin